MSGQLDVKRPALDWTDCTKPAPEEQRPQRLRPCRPCDICLGFGSRPASEESSVVLTMAQPQRPWPRPQTSEGTGLTSWSPVRWDALGRVVLLG